MRRDDDVPVRNSYSEQTDEIDILQLLVMLWNGKVLILTNVIVFFIVSFIYAVTIPETYKSDTVLAPVVDENASRLSSRFAGLAALTGINPGSSSVNKVTLGLEIFKSREFLTSFIKEQNLYAPLLAAKDWDNDKQEWIIDPKIYDSENDQWYKNDPSRPNKQPSDSDACEKLNEMLDISIDKDSGIVRISLTSLSAKHAKSWLELLVHDLNEVVRKRDILEAEKSIQFLQQELQKTNVTQMQQVFYKLIEEQIQTITLARVKKEYIFKVIDRPVIAEKKDGPKRKLIVISGIIGGGLFGVLLLFFFSLIKDICKRQRKDGYCSKI